MQPRSHPWDYSVEWIAFVHAHKYLRPLDTFGAKLGTSRVQKVDRS